MSFDLKAPKFWFRKRHVLSYLLQPAGFLYGLGVQLRFALSKPFFSKLPVICIGNFTVGGGGKTPLALMLADLLQRKGHKPVFLTRGYGGQIRGPHLVDTLVDNAVMVGDEPLLLAAVAPVVVSADRAAGARLIEEMEADVILMDDGFQNPGLFKDFSIVVVDETQGIGNERVFPAGPLRAPMAFQLRRANVLVIAGPASQAATTKIERGFAGEIYRTELVAKGRRGLAARGAGDGRSQALHAPTSFTPVCKGWARTSCESRTIPTTICLAKKMHKTCWRFVKRMKRRSS